MSEIAALIDETNELVETVRGFQPIQIPIQLQAMVIEQEALAVQAEAVQTNLTDLLAQLESYATTLESLSIGGEGLTDLCATHATDIIALQEQANTIATHLADLVSGQIATLDTTQTALSDSQADADGLILTLQTQTTAITDTLDDLTASLGALEQETASSDLATTQTLALLQTQADGLSAQIADLVGEQTGDDLVMDELVTQAGDFVVSINGLNSDMSDATIAIAALQAQATGFSTSLADAAISQGANATAITLVEGGLTAAQSEIATILASLSTLASDVTTLNGQMFLLQQQSHPVISHGILLTQQEITGTKTETPLYEAVQPANTWVPGDEFRFVLAGRIDGNKGTKEIRIRVNGVELFKAKMSSNTRHPWQAQGSVAIRPGNEAVVMFHLDYHEARVLHTTEVIAFDPAIENTLAITGKLSKETDHIYGEMARGETVHHALL